MKKILFIVAVIRCSLLQAQVPSSFGHRGVVFEADGRALSDTEVRIDVKIVGDSQDRNAVQYQENHYVLTNDRGEYAINIGDGEQASKMTMNQTDWADGSKYLEISIYDMNENLLGTGTNQLMSVPYALVAKQIAGGSSTPCNECIEVVENVAALRNISSYGDGDTVYLQGHTNRTDKGGGHFYYDANFGGDDDNGMTIQPAGSEKPIGRWRRMNYREVSVAFFGANGDDNSDDTDAIQAAIDFQSDQLDVGNSQILRGNVVYFPQGRYQVNEIILRYRVSLKGEGRSLIEPNPGPNAVALVRLESNSTVRRISIEDLNFNGGINGSTVENCFAFNFDVHGSTVSVANFKNLDIRGFKGDGFRFLGASSFGVATNQFVTMENVWIQKPIDPNTDSRALYMENQNGQFNFTNCTFLGAFAGNQGCENVSQPGKSIVIKSPGNGPFAAEINFRTCTIQQAEIGVFLEGAQNINFDSCWFENNTNSVLAINETKGINVHNSRFLNAACGYGIRLTTGSEGTFHDNLFRGSYGLITDTDPFSSLDVRGTIIDN